jgi:hypothetical protein
MAFVLTFLTMNWKKYVSNSITAVLIWWLKKAIVLAKTFLK